MSVLPKVLALSLLALLCACRSDPIHYHTLVPATADARGAASDLAIQVEQVRVPPQVDRSQIVIRQSNSGLEILETEWWGANLDEEVQSALAEQLSAPPGAGSNSARKVRLWVEVLRFDSVPGRYALLDVVWRFGAADTKSDRSCHMTVQTPAGNSIDALVVAHQANLRKLAAAIESTHGSLANGCPQSS
ncbi:PqiC family protein [Pseudomonas panipatensis]|uniref:PqiC family protein n=1 Tax=Pseudomonas panipatensis TaxID=428992 RepID=UPI0035B27168